MKDLIQEAKINDLKEKLEIAQSEVALAKKVGSQRERAVDILRRLLKPDFDMDEVVYDIGVLKLWIAKGVISYDELTRFIDNPNVDVTPELLEAIEKRGYDGLARRKKEYLEFGNSPIPERERKELIYYNKKGNGKYSEQEIEDLEKKVLLKVASNKLKELKKDVSKYSIGRLLVYMDRYEIPYEKIGMSREEILELYVV